MPKEDDPHAVNIRFGSRRAAIPGSRPVAGVYPETDDPRRQVGCGRP